MQTFLTVKDTSACNKNKITISLSQSIPLPSPLPPNQSPSTSHCKILKGSELNSIQLDDAMNSIRRPNSHLHPHSTSLPI